MTMSNNSSAAAIIDAAKDAASGPEPLPRGELHAFPVDHAEGGREWQVVDTEPWAGAPYAKRGQVVLHTGPSLAGYIVAHREPGTALYADVLARTITAVLNGHAASTAPTAASSAATLTGGDFTPGPSGWPGWGDHRAVLALRHTPEWLHWQELDRKLAAQDDFALHLERGLAEIVEPDAATMLETVQRFEATATANFRQAIRLQSGERKFVYEETVQARAGQRGDLTVPETFELGVAPFEGSPKYKVTARFRFRLREGTLQLGYELDRPDDVIAAAFDDVLKGIESETSLAAYRGTPAGPLR
jgi:uncharacterized protein YfdQ (DUF2303 family)